MAVSDEARADRDRIGDPQPIARALRRRRAGHHHRRRAGRPRRRPRSNSSSCARSCGPGSPPCPTPRTSRARRAGIVVGARRYGGDGASRGRRRGRRQCDVPAGRHPAVGDGARRAGRRAGFGADCSRSARQRRTCRAPTSTPTTFAARWRCSTAALSGTGRPTGLRVPDAVPQTELPPPAFDGPGMRYRDAMTVLDAALPDGADIVVDAGNTGAAAIHYLPVRRDGRFVVALGMGGMGYSFGAGVGHGFAQRGQADCRHRGRRLILHARHGDSHRDAVPAAGDVRAVQQQRARDVRDPRAAVLRRSVQLQPIRPEPTGRRPGRDVPGLAVGRRRSTSANCPTRCGPRSTPTARRW